MNILGLDVSSTCTGWALLGVTVEYGVIVPEGKDLARMLDFYSKMSNLCATFSNPVDWIVVEDIYHMNVKTTKILSRYGGIAMLVAGMMFKKTRFYDSEGILKTGKSRRSDVRVRLESGGIFLPSPTQALALNGIQVPKDRDEKKQIVKDWVRDTYHLDLESDDEADAIMLAASLQNLLKKV